MTLEVALLCRADSLIEKNFVGAKLLRQHLYFISFTAANKQRGIWSSSFAGDVLYRLEARCLGQQAELFKLVVEIGQAQIDTHKYDQRPAAGFNLIRLAREVLRTQLAGLSSESAAEKFTARPGTMVEMACL